MFDKIEPFYIVKLKIVDKTHRTTIVGKCAAFNNSWCFGHISDEILIVIAKKRGGENVKRRKRDELERGRKKGRRGEGEKEREGDFGN